MKGNNPTTSTEGSEPDPERNLLKAVYYVILKRRRIDLIRAQGGDRRIRDRAEEALLDSEAASACPASPDDWQACALDVLEDLPASQRTLIFLRNQGYSHREISDQLSLGSEVNARSHHFRAIREWRTRIEKKCGPKQESPSR